MSMYEAFRQHGSAAFCPDMSTVMLSEQGLSAAESGRAASSSSPTGRQHAPSAGASQSQSAPPEPGLDSQSAGQLTGADVARPEGCTGAGGLDVHVDPGSAASNRGHGRWPRDIQWRLDNPLVRPRSLAGACRPARTGTPAGSCARGSEALDRPLAC